MRYNYIAAMFGLTFGNYLYQLLLASTPNYFLAVERSFFQIAAIIIVWFLNYLDER